MSGAAFWTDTHAHFDEVEAAGETGAALDRAGAAGVVRVLAVGGDAGANALAVRLAERYPGRLRAAVGFHRDLAGVPPALETLDPWLARPETAAVGECGLDYSRPGAPPPDAQRRLFAGQLALAARHGLPVVVHSREAEADTLALLREHAGVRGVVHCFTGSADFAEALLDLGWHISFSGILTFRNAGALRETARRIPGDRVLLETDAPYLAPVPYRGRPNEPAYLPHTGRLLAGLHGLAEDDLARLTTANAERLFWRPRAG